MNKTRLALIGFGNVGRALARLLLGKEAELHEEYGIDFVVSGIATGRSGTAVNPDGLSIEKALELAEAGESLGELSTDPAPEDVPAFIRAVQADVVFENTPVNYASGQPALDHLRAALQAGCHAITANKGPVVHGYRELTELARQQERSFLFEATVMDGAPIFSTFRNSLPAARLQAIKGILNSTSNLILTRMETGESFEDAVAYAQSIGLAESDPSGDVDGWDAAIKLSILATVLMGEELKPDQVARQGIRDISPQMVAEAAAAGERWKLVCSANFEGDKLVAQVVPERVGQETPFYNIAGSTSIAQFETDVLGRLSIIGEDPGPDTTAYGLLADMISALS